MIPTANYLCPSSVNQLAANYQASDDRKPPIYVSRDIHDNWQFSQSEIADVKMLTNAQTT